MFTKVPLSSYWRILTLLFAQFAQEPRKKQKNKNKMNLHSIWFGNIIVLLQLRVTMPSPCDEEPLLEDDGAVSADCKR